LKLGI